MNKTKAAYHFVAISILAAIGVQRTLAVRRSASVVHYHDMIRNVATGVPKHVGPWIGEDVPVAVQATTLLRPNVMISRRYVNIENGSTAGLLLVHCTDAHAMAGHFPLRCYPARGWEVESAVPRDWIVEELQVSGMEYIFYFPDEALSTKPPRRIVVANCLLRPGGKVLRDMDAMVSSVLGAGSQASGAGQLQIYFDASVPQQQRDAAVVELIGGCADTVRSILDGPSKSTVP